MALATGLVASISPAGAGAGTLDQSQTTFNAALPFGESRHAAQTFTAGLDGNLDRVDLYARFSKPPATTCTRGSGITVELRTALADAPTDTTLATTSIPGLSMPTTFEFVSATFAAPAVVTAGNQYALVLSAPDAKCEEFYFPYDWGGAGGDTYLRGRGFVKLDAGSGWLAQTGYDNAFKTYVGPPAPPETPLPPGATGTPGTPAPPLARESARTLSIAYSQKNDVFRGKLASQAAACVSSQKVAVFEKKKGRDPKLGTSTTKANGRYSLKRERSGGRFYAKAGLSSSSGGTCLATRSKTIALSR